MIKVWCEWDMGFNGYVVDDYNTIYDTKEEAIVDISKANWKMVGFNSWEEVEAQGLLNIEEDYEEDYEEDED